MEGATPNDFQRQLQADLGKPVRMPQAGESMVDYVTSMKEEHGALPILPAALGVRNKLPPDVRLDPDRKKQSRR